jgi:putative NADH-flavin reductase
MKKIAIIGATGLLGKPVTKQLIQAGFDITIIARDIEKARALFPETPIIYGDLKNKTSLFEALKGQECVYLSLHISPNSNSKDFIPETDGLLHLLEAAKTNNIQRIAYLSSLVKDYQGQNGFNWWVFEAKQKAVQILKGSGIPYTIFYPSSFMENFDKGGFKSGNRLNLVGKSDVKMYWISGADYAKQVAKSFDLLTDENREYQAQGLEPYTSEEAANIFIQNYSIKKLKISRISFDFLKLMSKISKKINYISHILEAINKCPEKFGSQQTWDELGKPTETLKDYTLRIQKEKV